jgi:hypothetical protein
MELKTKKKSYRWDYMVSRELTRKIAESYIEKRSLDLLTSGLKLLNECIQDNGIKHKLNTWDKNHPLIQEVETLWLDIQSSEKISFNKSLTRFGSYHEQIATHLDRISATLTAVLKHVDKAVRFTKVEKTDVQPREKAPVIEKADSSVKQKTRKKIVSRNGFSFEQISGNPENRKELGKILSVARKNMTIPGEAQWTVRHTMLAIRDKGLQYEAYRDYSGMIRPPLTITAIYGIECGGAWPSAKALHALAELYKLDKETVEKIWNLIPYCLAKGVEEHCPKDSILFSHLAKPKVAEIQEVQETEPEQVIPDFVESLGETIEPVYRTKALHIAVIGQLDQNTARHQTKGFGRHSIVFIDGDKPRSIQPAFYDGAVALNRLSHAAWEVFNERCGRPPQLRFNRNGEGRVSSVNLLRAWLEQYDNNEVEIW